jgi:hypothetical protein
VWPLLEFGSKTRLKLLSFTGSELVNMVVSSSQL